MCPRQPHRILFEPACPNLRAHLTGSSVVGQLNGAVIVGGVTGSHRPIAEKCEVACLREGGPGAVVSKKRLERTAVLIAQGAHALRESSRVAKLEEGVSGVRRERAEYVWTQHRRDHRTVAAARLAGHGTVVTMRHGSIASVNPRDDLV